MDLYGNKASDAKTNAQRNLMGRTHYVDDATLRYHKSRVLSARAVDNGLLFAIVTSDALDMHNRSRGFRFVIFDLFGTVVAREDLENAYKTSAAATKAMWAKLDQLDARAITLEGIAKANRNHESDMDRVRDHLKAHQQKVAA